MFSSSLRRFKTMGAVVALALGLVGLGWPWVTIQLTTDSDESLGWFEIAGASMSFFIAAIAAWGATLLSHGLVSRSISGVQALLGLTALAFLIDSTAGVDDVVSGRVEQWSFLVGQVSSGDVVSSVNLASIALCAIAVAAISISGISGALLRQATPTTNRYDNTPLDTWDQLSRGEDPTG